MSIDTAANRALVLEAMTTLFQRKDPLAIERLYTPDYIQHNPGIARRRRLLVRGFDLFGLPGSQALHRKREEDRVEQDRQKGSGKDQVASRFGEHLQPDAQPGKD